MNSSPDELASALAERYRIERELGCGGMAVVYLAHDLKHDRQVALKVIRSELAGIVGNDRFAREIRLAARLQHPHICSVYDSGATPDGQLWYTMPFVAGESLRDRVKREGRLPIVDAVRITREAAQGLAFAHGEGIIHRDLKPENILLTRDGTTLVADFGIAKAAASASGPVATQLTETGFALGTPAYMSPEQRLGAPVDARSDVYSLAATLQELLTGESPNAGGSMGMDLFLAQMTDAAPRLKFKRPEISDQLEAVVRRGLSADPEKRFTTMAEFGAALDDATSGRYRSAGGGVGTGWWKRAALAGVVVMLFAAGFLLWKSLAHRTAVVAETAGLVRVAVLPFDNLGDSSNAYFAEGVSDEVRGKLTQLPMLEVIARPSSVLYARSSKPPRQIARELGVRYLLTGTVRWARAADGTSSVQVSPELIEINGTTERSRWQQPFNRALSDVFQVQSDIATQVASALNVALGAGQQLQLGQRPTQNLAAYDEYLKGRSLSRKDVNGMPGVITHFERAVALDSTFAGAWALLSSARSRFYRMISTRRSLADSAEMALHRALALAPDDPDTRRAAFQFEMGVRHDPRAALAAAQSGLAANPNDPATLELVAGAERQLGRMDEALAHYSRVEALDPRALGPPLALAQLWLYRRNWAQARAAADRALALDSLNLNARWSKLLSYVGEGDLAGARSVTHAVESGADSVAALIYFSIYEDMGWVLDATQQRLVLQQPLSAFDNDVPTWAMVRAQLYHWRGEEVLARAWADTAQRTLAGQAKDDPRWGELRAIRGLALALLGRDSEAVAEATAGHALTQATGDANDAAYVHYLLIRTLLAAKQPERALDELEKLLATPYMLSSGWLRIMPDFALLRGNPRFERLASAR